MPVDDIDFGRLLERVEQLAAKVEADGSVFVPREVCNLTHTAVAADRIATGQRLTDVERVQAELRQLIEQVRAESAQREAERSRDRWARGLGVAALVVSVLVAVIAALAGKG